MKFKGRKIKIEERTASFDEQLMKHEVERELEALAQRRQALRAKMNIFEETMKKIALEEIELKELLAEID